ncbi:MAG TPA: valine--tRNA ligase [Terriglobales bacterium]|nr:valine--tRNA ligase [Terriglobales bacterium]
MSNELPKAYEPGAIENRWAEYWTRENLFAVKTPADSDTRPVFTLLLPPPNVTGRLHMGHMLNQTEMDIIVRWHRMRGETSLWLPGTDHAGIATQMMVERQLASEGIKRQDLGREKFIERVWEWRKHYGGAILDQMKRLGASVDWHREYFTMDENLSHAVREVFVRLYDEGLIYRGKYIVNWCPRCGTAISDLEVVHEDFPGKLYEIRYPVIGTNEFLTVATTRPETMLGDTAVAVNPEDERYKHLHGKRVLLPLMNREIPVIADELAQPEFGTGVVKVTPAHDANDFAAGLRHDLPRINIMDEHGRMNENAGRYAGHDRFEARERVMNDLREQGFFVGERDYTVPIGKCDRCKTIVEPRLSTQWFVAVNKEPSSGGLSMAKAASDAVSKGFIRFTPENYKTIYLQWMENIHDWCISRQLWWGHRIPAWHCQKCGEIIVARETPAHCKNCAHHELIQDTDVLDTWFSSALLPFTTLGWPENTRDLETFYPTSLLITGFDILFFWVARMIMMGCHFMSPPHKPSALSSRQSGHSEILATDLRIDGLAGGEASVRITHIPTGLEIVSREGHTQQDNRVLAMEMLQKRLEERYLAESVPFREVYIHALVRDAERQKMSKTKGNVLDPIQVIEKYGTDATRFTLAAMASPGTDIAFSESRTEGYRSFANKIWNAARFMFMNVDRAAEAGVWSLKELRQPRVAAAHESSRGEGVCGIPIFKAETLDDRWILSRFNQTAQQVNDALQTYRFHEAAHVLYSFFWGELCDWYIELIKNRLADFESDKDRQQARVACQNLASLFEASLRLLSPIMPFITEEIWHAIYNAKPPVASIALAAFPSASQQQIDLDAEQDMAILQDLVVSVRNLRAEMKVEPRTRTPIEVHADASIWKLIRDNAIAVERLANVDDIRFTEHSLAKEAGARGTARFDVRVIYERKIDVGAERQRLQKELERIEKEIGNGQRQLSNEGFLSKAPTHVVDGLRRRAEELQVLRNKAKTALDQLG